MAKMLLEVADRCSDGRIAFLLEGGYDLAALRNSVAAVLDALRVRTSMSAQLNASAGERLQPLVRRIQQVHEKFRL
jgi:acetoin utilization deacetylase AcuC-like enzyme